MSSLVQKPSGVPANWELMAIIVRSGLTRPGTPPICGPRWSSLIASENRFPVRTAAAPRLTASASIRFMVPSSSSSPQRPQLETRVAISRNSSVSHVLLRRRFAVLGRRVHRILVELWQHFLAEELHRIHDRLEWKRVGRRAEGELVDADIDPLLNRFRAVVGVAVIKMLVLAKSKLFASSVHGAGRARAVLSNNPTIGAIMFVGS